MADEQKNTDVPAAAHRKTIADLFDGSPYRHFPARHMIYYQGDKVERFYYVISGYVRMYSITQKGNERIFAIIGPGESMPLIQSEYVQYFYDALTEVEVAYSTYDVLVERFLADKDYMEAARDTGVMVMNRLTAHMEVLASDSAYEKIELAVMFLAKYYGEQRTDYTEIKFRVTHQLLADLVNLTRETVTSMISKLEKAHKIRISKNGHLVIPAENERSSEPIAKAKSTNGTIKTHKVFKNPVKNTF